MELRKCNDNILDCNIKCILSGSNVWFNGKDIAKSCGYDNTTKL